MLVTLDGRHMPLDDALDWLDDYAQLPPLSEPEDDILADFTEPVYWPDELAPKPTAQIIPFPTRRS